MIEMYVIYLIVEEEISIRTLMSDMEIIQSRQDNIKDKTPPYPKSQGREESLITAS